MNIGAFARICAPDGTIVIFQIIALISLTSLTLHAVPPQATELTLEVGLDLVKLPPLIRMFQLFNS